MSSENSAPVWEACKENVIPIKRGRSAKGLSESLQKTSEIVSNDKLREKFFEDKIIAAGKSSTKELLDAYVLYFKWTRDAYPSNVEKPLNLLEVNFTIMMLILLCCMEQSDEAENSLLIYTITVNFPSVLPDR